MSDFPTNLVTDSTSMKKQTEVMWDDYRIHDPGVTIYDFICSKLSELTSKLDTDVKDVLADSSFAEPETVKPGQHSPDTILPSRAVTINDYRKLLMDVRGVRNAWVRKITTDDHNHHGLNGLYRIEIEPHFNDSIYDYQCQLSNAQQGELDRMIVEAENRYLQNRNLGEDLGESQYLARQGIALRLNIWVSKGYDKQAVFHHCIAIIENQIAPQASFKHYQQMLDKGLTADQIFDGPKLEFGFIDDAELGLVERAEFIELEKIKSLLEQVDGVIHAELPILLDQNSHDSVTTNGTRLQISPQHIYQFDLDKSLVELVQDGEQISVAISDADRRYLNQLRSASIKVKPEASALKPAVIKGEDHGLAQYHSVQSEFPRCYMLEAGAITVNTTEERAAQVKQLRGFLFILEQLITDQQARLANVKANVSFAPQLTYQTNDKGIDWQHLLSPAGLMVDAPELESILNGQSHQQWRQMWQSTKTMPAHQIRQRLQGLKHLLDRFADGWQADPQQDVLSQLQDQVNTLERILQQYPDISANRMSGWCYRQSNRAYESFTGLQRRMCLEFFNSADSDFDIFEPFDNASRGGHLKEWRFAVLEKSRDCKTPNHELLISRRNYSKKSRLASEYPNVLRLGAVVDNYRTLQLEDDSKLTFELYDDAGKVLAYSPHVFDKQVDVNDAIRRCADYLAERWQPIPLLLVEHVLLRPLRGEPAIDDQHHYDFRVTVVIEKDSHLLRNDRTQRQLINAILNQLPSHIEAKILLLDRCPHRSGRDTEDKQADHNINTFDAFERIYSRFVEAKVNKSSSYAQSRDDLKTWLIKRWK